MFAADFIVAKRLAWTPGGFALSFGRMLQDGIVKKYLDQHCPDPTLTAVRLQGEFPSDADVWFWGSTCSTSSAVSPGSARRWKKSRSTA